ncbi:MAG: FAD-binding protein, partial [Tissierellia bacterium]|nr:FAD-binding protein [Tissierellia bacterium]
MKLKIKRTLIFILIIAMVLSVAACQGKPKEEDKGLFKAGKYVGEGQGLNGPIKVEVTVTADEITEIKVLEHKETPGVSDLAIKDVPASIVEGQGLAVDIVAGATYSSNGIIEAVTKALEQADADINALKTLPVKQEKEKTTTEKQTDVVIIGAGGAGLASAVSANENGARVIVLEKMPKVGGNTIISGAAYNAVDPKRQEAQGIEDSIEKHYTQTYEGGDKKGNPELIRVLVENAYPTIEWLEGMGMEFKPELFTVLGGMWPRAHAPVKPLGTGFIDTFMNYIDEHKDQMEVMVNTKVTEITMENGKVLGVKAEGPDGDVIIRANAVIVAAGGFGNSIEMRNEYNTQWPDLTKLKSTNHPGATGDGITMAEAAGANLVGMEYIQLLPMGDPDTGSLSGNIEQSVENRIFVNKDGSRFVDEGARRDVMTKALFEQEDAFMWVVLDSQNYPTGDEKNHFNESINELVAAKRAYKADTLEDLAEQIGVDPSNLVKTVEDFNAHVDSKEA